MPKLEYSHAIDSGLASDSVPDFFQETDMQARLLQMQWLREKLDLSDAFFADVLGESRAQIVQWLIGLRRPSPEFLTAVGNLWAMFLHLFSLFDFDYEKASAFLRTTCEPVPDALPSLDRPRWAGSTAEEYLQSHGAEAVEHVTRWITSLRFGNSKSVAS